MRVKMLQDAPGSPDGVTVNEYSEGVVYEVTDDLGNAFVAENFAEETTDDVTPDETPVEDEAGEDTESKPRRRSRKVTEPEENK